MSDGAGAGDNLYLNVSEVRFNWVAYYGEDNYQTQFEEDGTERTFKDIDQENLKGFALTNGKETIAVNLNNGIFTINKIPLIFQLPKAIRSEGLPTSLRLIYFRRNMYTIIQGVGSQLHRIYVLGYQCTVSGINYKRMLGIDDEGVLHYLEE